MADVDLGIEGIEGATEIGRGGFGVVYRAVETELDRTVAIKVLTGDFDDRARVRFDRERRAMGSLSGHANIVTVYRSGFTQRDQPFILMEYLAGGTIADRLRREGRLPWPDVVQLGIEIARALGAAHRLGVLHRDVKPGNILLGATGLAKLGDFGIARLHGAPETKSAVITASVAHAPPEVLGGARPDERADIYSLASTLFELAWGAPAFVRPDDESLVPMMSRIVMEPPPDLRAVGVPDAVARVIDTAMAKNAEQRIPTADGFAEALERARASDAAPAAAPPSGGQPTMAVAPPSDGAQPSTGVPPFAPFASQPAPGRSSRTPWIIAAAAAVLAVLVGVVVVATRPGDDTGSNLAQLRTSTDATDPDATAPDTDTGDATPNSTDAEPTPTSTPTTASPPSTPPSSAPAATAPPAQPGTPAATRHVVNDSGAISVLVPAAWDEQTGDASTLLVTPDLDAALNDEWVKGVLLQAVRNTPELNPGGFAPDVTLNQLIADSECVTRERGPYADANFIGSYAVVDQCGNSGLSNYYLVAAPSDLSMVVLVAVAFESPAEDAIVQQILDSAVWSIGALP